VEVPFEIMHLPELDALVAVPLKEPCYLHLERAQAQEHWVSLEIITRLKSR
jgi:hypothetical protein